ncbi:MAG: hypothetical protein H5T85_07455 [Actinobacteria bacterium]|nr:hypothetical protein [Actinomycetota bacterium]
MLKVINGQVPDRVPVSLFIHDEGNFLSQIYPDLDLEDPISCKFRLIDLERELGIDIILRMLHGIRPFWASYGGLNTETQTENWEVRLEEYRRGKSLVKNYLIKTPEREFTQEFSISEIAPGTFSYACTKKPIKSIDDLETAIKYEPPMRENYPVELKEMVCKVKSYLGNDGITSIWVPAGAFNAAAGLVDLDLLYSIFLTDKLFFEKLMDFTLKRTLPFVEATCNSGIDTISIGGNVPGGFLGSKIYEEYVLPYEKKYIELAKSKGVITIYHNCGQIMALVDSYKELGSDIVEPFSPPPLGDGDLREAKKKSEGKFVIIGNVDQVNVLKDGSKELVRRVTEETIKIGKPGGKFILQTADYLEYGTPLENIKTYIETALKNSGY